MRRSDIWRPRADSLFCGKATAVARFPRNLAKSRLSNPLFCNEISDRRWCAGLIFGVPERIRTADLPLRRRMLYPAELRRHTRLSALILFFICRAINSRRLTDLPSPVPAAFRLPVSAQRREYLRPPASALPKYSLPPALLPKEPFRSA